VNQKIQMPVPHFGRSPIKDKDFSGCHLFHF